MQDEELRIAVALACGWTKHERPLCDDLGPIGDRMETCWHHPSITTKDKRFWPTLPPDYPNDPAAMRKAVLSLKAELWHVYIDNLMIVCGKLVNMFFIFNPEPRQQAEAFVMTIKRPGVL